MSAFYYPRQPDETALVIAQRYLNGDPMAMRDQIRILNQHTAESPVAIRSEILLFTEWLRPGITMARARQDMFDKPVYRLVYEDAKLGWLAKRIALSIPPIRRLYAARNELAAQCRELSARLEAKPTLPRLFFRAYDGTPIRWPTGFEVDDGPSNPSVLERLRAAYVIASVAPKRAPAAPADAWGSIIEGHREIAKLLLDNRLEEAEAYLRRQYSMPLTHGFQQGQIAYEHLTTNSLARMHMHRIHADRLLRLAEAFAVLPVENPEQGERGKGFDTDPDELLLRIEREFGAALDAPRWQGGLFGLRTSRGTFTERHFGAIYLAKRISEICPDRRARICEIGAGAGYLAYFCQKLGYGDFTIVDLPTVNISQAYLLLRAMPDARFRLQGEPGAFEPNGAVRILADTALESAPDRCFDLVVNVDSLPEMATQTAKRTCEAIRRVGRQFLSVNQEARAPRTTPDDLQDRVSDLVRLTGGFRRLSRAPFWMREGYVEELYSLEHDAPGNPVVS